MALYITSLNSGSNGNCFYVGNGQEAVLVDAGLSCKETELRLHQCGLNMQTVKAIFVSHEHGDHIKGLEAIALKYNLPVYCSAQTRHDTILIHSKANYHHFTHDGLVHVGNLTIIPFKKYHDARDAHSFVVSYGEISVGIFTDIGRICQNVIKYYQQCTAVFLEANYDEDMLANGNYPSFLKQRITGGFGHISNREALEMALKYKPTQLSHLLLSHLSKNNNCPTLVEQLFKNAFPDLNVMVAGRDSATPVLQIGLTVHISPKKMNYKNKRNEQQLCLF